MRSRLRLLLIRRGRPPSAWCAPLNEDLAPPAEQIDFVLHLGVFISEALCSRAALTAACITGDLTPVKTTISPTWTPTATASPAPPSPHPNLSRVHHPPQARHPYPCPDSPARLLHFPREAPQHRHSQARRSPHHRSTTLPLSLIQCVFRLRIRLYSCPSVVNKSRLIHSLGHRCGTRSNLLTS